MGPLEVVYSWQSLLIAVLAAGISQFVKRAIDILHGWKENGDGRLDMLEAIGQELRKDSIVIQRLLLPMLPIIFGALLATVLPLRPEVITDYVQAHGGGVSGHLIFTGYGAACGQFADYIFHHVTNMVGDLKKREEA